jgi:hypothetical protein
VYSERYKATTNSPSCEGSPTNHGELLPILSFVPNQKYWLVHDFSPYPPVRNAVGNWLVPEINNDNNN